MAFRFQKRVTLLPGVRLNLSRRGISTTIGVPGASVNLGATGATSNLGIPGTGLSIRKHLSPGPQPYAPPMQGMQAPEPMAQPHVAEKTSEGLGDLRALVLQAAADRAALRTSIANVQRESKRAKARLRRARNWFLRIFLGGKVAERTAAVESRQNELDQLQGQLGGTYVHADFGLEDAARNSFANLVAAFEVVCGCAKIWDVTGMQFEDRRVTRSSASINVTRQETRFSFAPDDDVIQTDSQVLQLGSADGTIALMYSGLIALRSANDLALIDPRELKVDFVSTPFVETGGVPPDSEVIDFAWAKSNKDGSPDRRFANNYKIPVARYGSLRISSSNGFTKHYQFSSYAKAKQFAEAFANHQKRLRSLGGEVHARAETARCVMPQLNVGSDHPAVFVVRFASAGTDCFGSGSPGSPVELAALADIYAQAVIVAWENIVQNDGTVPPCTPDNVKRFLSGLLKETGGADVFMSLVNFARDPRNFAS